MLHLVIKPVVHTSDATITRDIRTIEDAVNGFVKDPSVQVKGYKFQEYAVSTTQYVLVAIEYDLRPR